MIFNWIADLTVVAYSRFSQFVLNLLPVSTGLPSDVSTSVAWFITQLDSLNWFFPVSTLLQILVLVLAFESAILAAKVVMKIFNYIRGTSS